MISDYLKKYSTYYLSRYSVTKKKFENILKKKITKDFFEKKIDNIQHEKFKDEIVTVVKYFEKIGVFNEERLLEISFQNYIKKGYSKIKIKNKIKEDKYNDELIRNFLIDKFRDDELEIKLIKNFLKKNKTVEKQKKLNISEKQLFDKIIYKLINQGFSYETSRKVLEKMISNGNI